MRAAVQVAAIKNPIASPNVIHEPIHSFFPAFFQYDVEAASLSTMVTTMKIAPVMASATAMDIRVPSLVVAYNSSIPA